MDGVDGVFVVLEFTGRPNPQKNAMLVKYNGHDVCDSAKLMMSTEEALSFAGYCRFKSYFIGRSRLILSGAGSSAVTGVSGRRSATHLVARERLQRRSHSSAAHA